MAIPQSHRMAEVGRDLWMAWGPESLPGQENPEPAVQDPVQTSDPWQKILQRKWDGVLSCLRYPELTEGTSWDVFKQLDSPLCFRHFLISVTPM